MSVNMSGIDKNPFRIGDKVKVKAHVLRAWSRAFKNYLPIQYAVVTKLDSVHVFTDVDDKPTNFEHFELYKEPEEPTMKQPKTKRIPFTHEVWEKHKDVAKIIYIPSGGEVLGFAYFPEADSRFHYAYLTRSGTAPTFGCGESFLLEIPVTTKRIPFNPELKDTKVFTKDSNQAAVDWVVFKDGRVACQWPNQYMGYYPTNLLEMEIEEED